MISKSVLQTTGKKKKKGGNNNDVGHFLTGYGKVCYIFLNRPVYLFFVYHLYG